MWSSSIEVLNPYEAIAHSKKTVCPICKNEIGFAFGVCSRCGYNHLSHEYFEIKVNTEVLKALVPEEIYYKLVEEHEQYYRR